MDSPARKWSRLVHRGVSSVPRTPTSGSEDACIVWDNPDRLFRPPTQLSLRLEGSVTLTCSTSTCRKPSGRRKEA